MFLRVQGSELFESDCEYDSDALANLESGDPEIVFNSPQKRKREEEERRLSVESGAGSQASGAGSGAGSQASQESSTSRKGEEEWIWFQAFKAKMSSV